LLHPVNFTTQEKERQFYWKIRKGMFPSVGAVRQRGTTVILEDIAFPVEQLADAVVDLQQLFVEFGYYNAIIFGHAKEGNIHFVVTQWLNSAKEIARYDAFMRKVVDLVLKKYDGTLKAEHGTGRNMAPFVEAEWGGVAYRIMQELKASVDPYNLLNPGVIINPDKEAHLKT
jgi:D-lactate dehydrogenase